MQIMRTLLVLRHQMCAQHKYAKVPTRTDFSCVNHVWYPPQLTASWKSPLRQQETDRPTDHLVRVHAICFISDKWNFNKFCPYFSAYIFDSFWAKRLVSNLAVPYSLSLLKHTACSRKSGERRRRGRKSNSPNISARPAGITSIYLPGFRVK